jgi:ClpP class serine protease
VAYADQYLQASYYVATVADNVYLNAEGMIDFKGLGRKGEYMKGLYDKIGVRYQAAKVGKYKSYVESNTQTGMSDYDREQREAYTQGIWQHWLSDIAESRKVTAEQLNQLANDSIMAFANTSDYVKAGLIDKVMFPEEIKAEIKKRLKLDKDDDIHQLTLSDMLNVKSEKNDDGEITDGDDRSIAVIKADIICSRDSHKGIIIGKGGSMLKKIGTNARFECEKMLEAQVNLKLWVKVKKDWRDSDYLIKNFGYRKDDYDGI